MTWRAFFGLDPDLDDHHPGHTKYQAIFWLILIGCAAAYLVGALHA